MTRNELIRSISKKLSISYEETEKVFYTVILQVKKELNEKEEVRIKDFGTFKKKEIKEKEIKHPVTKESIMVPKHNKIKFKQSKNFFLEEDIGN